MESKSKVTTEMDVSYLNLLMEPSFIVGDDRIITWANDPFFKTFNLKSANVVNRMTCEEACPTHLCGTKDCPSAKAIRIKKPVEAEVIYRNGGTSVQYFASRAVPMNGTGSGT